MCLLCRQEARVAASDRRKKLFLRGSAVAIVVAVVALGMSSAITFRSRAAAHDSGSSSAPAAAKIAAAPPVAVDSVIPQAAAVTAAPTSPTPTAAAPNSATSGDAVLSPTIKVGDTPLANGIVATRGDSGVFVTFDTPDFRTRSPEKFERFLRTTLPQIYGAPIDTVLAAIPVGKIVAQGNLLYDLPTRAIQLPVRPGWHLEVFPEIRPGKDGPLVVRYRSTVAKD